MVSGIKIDANGRAVFARVWNRTQYGQFEKPQEIPFNQLLHVFDSDRIDSVSGVTAYASVLNTVRDYKETGEAERLAAKRNSKLALLIKSVMGGASSPAVDLFGDGDGSSGRATDGKVNVNPVGDVADAYMFPQEDMKAHDNPRPSGGWLQFMELLIREIAAALDLPFGVVWHMSGLGGPAVRVEMADANRTFVSFLEDVIEPMWIRPTVGSWLAAEIKAGRLPASTYWYRFTVPKPAALSIDLGRDSKAGIEENKAGLLTASAWAEEVDESFEEVTDQMIYEARYRECKRRGIAFDAKLEVPLDQIRQMTPNGNPSQTNPDGSKIELDENGKPIQKETDDEVNFDSLKSEFDAYGVGVRAGTITPTIEDENYFRSRAGLPPLSSSAKSAWSKESIPNTRRPITLTPPDGAAPKQNQFQVTEP